jgi:predicted amidohydrolase
MKDGFIAVACATPALRLGDCHYNAEQTFTMMREAHKRGVKVLVLPELGLTGYTCGDLFYQNTLIRGAEEALATILEATAHNCYYSVLPAVYESVMKVKFSESLTDSAMFDLIRNSMCVDAAYAFNQQNAALSDMVYMLYRLDSGRFSSKLASLSKPLEKGMEKLNNTYRELAERE